MKLRHLRLLLGTFFAFQITHALAQESTHGVELLDDGTVSIQPLPQTSATTAEFNVPVGTPMSKWFALTNPDGEVETYIFLPEGQGINANFLNNLEPGQAIVKANAPDFFGIRPPSAEQVRSIIEGILSSARQAVCDLGASRPSTFGTAVDVSAGIGISGTIQFSAEWETERLCANL